AGPGRGQGALAAAGGRSVGGRGERVDGGFPPRIRSRVAAADDDGAGPARRQRERERGARHVRLRRRRATSHAIATNAALGGGDAGAREQPPTTPFGPTPGPPRAP